ncbi:heme peroxidase [Blyttiomyces helicus]|uniref:Peroxidase n=1 Tax=Blyttiomyces helicus TaxID=388810 RepID=A0A4P9WBD8_9FUNG|nr:heme peroxidase [Blyttiomyces helicus]|eukprot:RKO88230.1 heme peroxidase [Blyttiomyces helicus]
MISCHPAFETSASPATRSSRICETQAAPSPTYLAKKSMIHPSASRSWPPAACPSHGRIFEACGSAPQQMAAKNGTAVEEGRLNKNGIDIHVVMPMRQDHSTHKKCFAVRLAERQLLLRFNFYGFPLLSFLLFFCAVICAATSDIDHVAEIMDAALRLLEGDEDEHRIVEDEDERRALPRICMPAVVTARRSPRARTPQHGALSGFRNGRPQLTRNHPGELFHLLDTLRQPCGAKASSPPHHLLITFPLALLAMFARVLYAAFVLAAAAPLASAQAHLPDNVTNRRDFIYQLFADRVKLFVAENGCGGDSAKNPKTGRVLPPLWLRFIFHDSATWFQSNGSFGFDGSIVNELGRPGNEGLAIADMAHHVFPGSLGNFSDHTSILMPDSMNLAAIATIAACGGPEIKFTSGLAHPGPDPHHLLPLPSDSNALSVENMFRMGFNASQTVAIVTGSHTLGGVHGANNPHLTSLEFAPFDFTPTVFDNDIFKQVLAGDCRIPFDCFMAQNEPFKTFVELFANDQDAFFTAYADAYQFMETFNNLANPLFTHKIDLTPFSSGLSVTNGGRTEAPPKLVKREKRGCPFSA